MGETGLKTCTGFLAGGACPLVGGAGSCPSGGLDRVKGYAERLCAHPVSCWPVASQHWCLQTLGWGQVLVLIIRWQPPGGFVRLHVPQYV